MKMKTMLPMLLIVAGCGKNGNSCLPEEYSYTFLENKRIDTTKIATQGSSLNMYSWQLTDGNNVVFKHSFSFKDCPEIADDEGLQTIIFEIPQDLDQFRFEDSAGLQAAKALITLSCECYPMQPVLFSKGWIEGTKINASEWMIKASLFKPWDTTQAINFKSVFKED